MKYSLSLLFILFYSFSFSQDCSYIDQLDADDSWTYSTYNAKDKHQSDAEYTVLKTRNNSDSTIITLHTLTGEKDDEIELTYDISCYKGTIYLNMEQLVGPMTQKMKGMEVEIVADAIEIPSNPAIGDTLMPATVKIDAMMNGKVLFTMTVTIKNRKVTAKESLTTSAGTFNCYVIEQTVEVDHMMGKATTSGKEWYSDTNGMIRSENYDKKGKLDSYTILSKQKI